MSRLWEPDESTRQSKSFRRVHTVPAPHPTLAHHAPRCRRDALDFLAKLSRKYSGRVTQLLERRREQQARFDAGEKPVFLPETKKVGRSVKHTKGG